MDFFNLTPHNITICGKVFPPSGMVARVSDIVTEETTLDGIPAVTYKQNDNTLLLPARRDNVYLLVSRAVAQVVRRGDVYFPTDFIRDRSGDVVGAKKIARFE